jgi:hypothetical protein
MRSPFYVIGITGKKQTGKSTFANAIVSLHANTGRYAFVKPLKEVCHTLFGGTESNWYGDFKTQILEAWEGKLPFQATPRKIMQFVGTEMFRHTLNNDFWLHVARRYIDAMYKEEGFDLLVVDDVRFDNEAAFLCTEFPDSVIVKLQRNDLKFTSTHDNDQHVSEKGVSYNLIDFNYTINNIDDHKLTAADLLRRCGVLA